MDSIPRLFLPFCVACLLMVPVVVPARAATVRIAPDGSIQTQPSSHNHQEAQQRTSPAVQPRQAKTSGHTGRKEHHRTAHATTGRHGSHVTRGRHAQTAHSSSSKNSHHGSKVKKAKAGRGGKKVSAKKSGKGSRKKTSVSHGKQTSSRHGKSSKKR